MKRSARAGFAVMVLILVVSPLFAQEPLFPEPPDETWTILQTLDAVDAVQLAVLETPEIITESDLENMHRLVDVAEVIGAEDLAARTRTLIVLSSFARDETPPELAQVDGGVSTVLTQPPARDTDAFRRWVNVGATVGASALGMSAVFYYLAERNYQAWLIETDDATSEQLVQAWKGYDLMGLTLGTATLLTVGVGMPVVFSLTPPSTTLATPPAAATFTQAGKNAELERLYEDRVRIVDRINRLNERERRRSITRAVAFASGAAGALGAGTFFYLGEETYARYLAETDPTAAEALGKRVNLFDVLAIGFGALGGAGLGTAATMAIITPDRSRLERDLERVNASIIRVRASRTIDAPDPEPEPESRGGENPGDEGASDQGGAESE